MARRGGGWCIGMLPAGMLPVVSPPAPRCSSSRPASVEHFGVTRFSCSSSATDAGAKLRLQPAYTRCFHTLQRQRAGRTMSFFPFRIRVLAAASESRLPSSGRDPSPRVPALNPARAWLCRSSLPRSARVGGTPGWDLGHEASWQVTESFCFQHLPQTCVIDEPNRSIIDKPNRTAKAGGQLKGGLSGASRALFFSFFSPH